MKTLFPTLLDHDMDLLAIIANRWDVDWQGLDQRDAARALAEAMLVPEQAAAEWARLNDDERGALQMLLSAPDHRLTLTQYSRLFGELRQMGPGRREREKPHLHPVSVVETLFYRGLISVGVAEGRTGIQQFVYVPGDLAEVLPSHETGFDLDETVEPMLIGPVNGMPQPQAIEPATTTLVDDLTTLLAFLQIHQVPSQPEELQQRIRQDMTGCWLGQERPAWLALLIALAGGMGLAANQQGLFKPVPARARQWLEDTRPRQVRALALAWRESTLFNDLWHTPGLEPEDTGWRNDPLLARQTVLNFLEMVPPHDWWPVDELIQMVRTEEPDFQRPAGDYNSWYLRDQATGEYLRGFESWDRVDGAVLRFILTGSMHWLGLVDLGDGGKLCRLTVYGRALCGETEWPDPPEDRVDLVLEPDGTVLTPRTASRYERFQLARITEWGAAGDPYTYRLTAAGLQQGAEQGLPLDAVRAFLRRTTGASALPETVARMLDQWAQMGDAAAWMTRAVILRTHSPETLETILEEPELRRYLGATLGPTAVIVRAGQADDLAAALHQHGILVEFDDH